MKNLLGNGLVFGIAFIGVTIYTTLRFFSTSND